ncbi:cytochrome C biogenesis transmembrane region family protein [Mycobacterium ulcerans str. Harvey]|uniref:Cytochrome C biogenesis transmembrane region family protein n=1 Tax=Mycobacterium ulcerans str. Harvey TaxID=1299332 RepID=A0ABN0QZW5_MYCUL|nr:cytochrome C biogenesis transmembrane region family protein [Mycobacterium ulcerans str. Harvey]
MNSALVALAFAAGSVAALNPCGFAMLPAYLLLVVRGQHGGESGEAASPIGAVGRAIAATIGMALGFLTVFGAFGALTISAASTVQRYLPYLTVLIGVLLFGLGVWLLSGRELAALTLAGLVRDGRQRPAWVPCTATASAMPSPRCPAPSGRLSR